MKKRIAFDFDGVIANTTIMKKEWFKKNKNIELKHVDKKSIYEELGKRYKKRYIDILYKKMSKDIFTRDILLNTPPVKDSIETIKRLSKKYDIFIVTSRTNEMIRDVDLWLIKYGLDKYIYEVISSSFEKKQLICKRNNIESLCDDDKRHIEDVIIEKTIYFNDDGIGLWKDVEKYIKENV